MSLQSPVLWPTSADLPPWWTITRFDDPPAPSAQAPAGGPAADPPADTPPADPPPATGDELGATGKKALDEERRARKEAEKARKTLEDRIKEFEDRDKTELQKAQEAATAAEERATNAERESLRLRIAAETALPAELHEFLVGDTEDALRAKAQKLTAFAANRPPKVPAPDPSQGTKPPAPPEDMRTASKEEFAAGIGKLGLRPKSL